MDEFTPQELARLVDYFAQELQPDEVDIVDGWINGQPDIKSFVQELQRSRLGFGMSSEHAGHSCPSAAVEAISQNLAQVRAAERMVLQGSNERDAERGDQYRDDSHAGNTKRVSRSYDRELGSLSHLRRPTLSVVVACALLMIAGWFSFNHSQPSADSVAMTTYETANGERATVTLPDGSVITLNVGSRVQVPLNYSDDNRTVKLVGEALFTVTHKGKAPFTVLSGPSITRVLGTQFVVRHYSKDDRVNIAVQEGKVSVGETVLSAGQQLSMNEHSGGVVQSVDANRFNFAVGMLTLDKVPLIEAIPDLNRWYNADIQLGDPALAGRKIIGGFKLGSLTDLAAILELTFDVRVVRDANTLTLYNK